MMQEAGAAAGLVAPKGPCSSRYGYVSSPGQVRGLLPAGVADGLGERFYRSTDTPTLF